MEEAGWRLAPVRLGAHPLRGLGGARTTTTTSSASSCDHIIEFENDEIEALQDSGGPQFGFNILRHRHELFGLCEKAQGIPGGRCPGEESTRRAGRKT